MAIGTPLGLGTHNQAASATNILTTTTNDCPVGSFILVYVSFTTIADTLTGVTDSAGNTYVVLENETGTGIGIGIAYCNGSLFDLPVGGTITATLGGSVTSELGAVCVSGISPTSPIDISAKTSNGLAATSAASVNTGTRNQSNEILFGFLGCAVAAGIVTLGGSWNSIANSSNSLTSNPTLVVAQQIVSTTASVAWAPSWANTSNYVTDLITVKGILALPDGTNYDLSLPRPRRYPMENLGFIRDLDLGLIGKDQFPPAFVGRSYDLPPPRLKRMVTLMDPQAQRAQYIPGRETLPVFVADLSLPLPRPRRMTVLGDTQSQRAQYIPGRETLPGFVADLSLPAPRAKRVATLMEPQANSPSLVGQETLPKQQPDLSLPVVRARRIVTLVDVQANPPSLVGQETLPKQQPDLSLPVVRARRVTTLVDVQANPPSLVGQETLPKQQPDLSLPAPRVKRVAVWMDVQTNPPSLVGKETLPKFIADLSLPLPRKRMATLMDPQANPPSLVGQETLPKFNVEWRVPPPYRYTLENRGFIKDLDIQLIGKDQLPAFVPDLRIPSAVRRQIASELGFTKNFDLQLLGTVQLPFGMADMRIPMTNLRFKGLTNVGDYNFALMSGITPTGATVEWLIRARRRGIR